MVEADPYRENLPEEDQLYVGLWGEPLAPGEVERELGSMQRIPVVKRSAVEAELWNLSSFLTKDQIDVQDGISYIKPEVMHTRILEREDGKKQLTYYIGPQILKANENGEGSAHQLVETLGNRIGMDSLGINIGIDELTSKSIDTIWFINMNKDSFQDSNIRLGQLASSFNDNILAATKAIDRSTIISQGLGREANFFIDVLKLVPHVNVTRRETYK